MHIAKTSKSYYDNFMNPILLIFYIASLFFTIATSEVITVGGDENRWTDGFNYVSWAQNHTFTVGDVLVFKYSVGAHNVYDVTRTTFQSCDPSSGVNARYNSGDDHVELTEAKQYWFICTVGRHCQLGMRFGVNVSAAAPPATNSASDHNTPLKYMNTGFYLLVVGILSMLVFVV